MIRAGFETDLSEMPENCFKCRYGEYIETEHKAGEVTYRIEKWFECGLLPAQRLTDSLEARPSYCPLDGDTP